MSRPPPRLLPRFLFGRITSDGPGGAPTPNGLPAWRNRRNLVVDRARDPVTVERQVAQRSNRAEAQGRAHHPQRDAAVVEILHQREAEAVVQRLDHVEQPEPVALAPRQILPADAELHRPFAEVDVGIPQRVLLRVEVAVLEQPLVQDLGEQGAPGWPSKTVRGVAVSGRPVVIDPVVEPLDAQPVAQLVQAG